jgi:multisubunit Na+/H+ antiporter MnhF subunit
VAEDPLDDLRKLSGAGGTPGGAGEFLAGFCMAVAGGWLLTNQVTVTSGFWQMWGHSAFGLSLLPLCVGIGWLFFDGKSPAGWLLTLSGLVIILVGVLTNLEIYFRPTSLFNTLLMLALLAGGLGLIARALRAH